MFYLIQTTSHLYQSSSLSHCRELVDLRESVAELDPLDHRETVEQMAPLDLRDLLDQLGLQVPLVCLDLLELR